VKYNLCSFDICGWEWPQEKYPEIDAKSRIIQNIYCDNFNYMARKLIIFTLHEILLGWQTQWGWSGWTCGTHGKDVTFIQNLSRRTEGETSWQTCVLHVHLKRHTRSCMSKSIGHYTLILIFTLTFINSVQFLLCILCKHMAELGVGSDLAGRVCHCVSTGGLHTFFIMQRLNMRYYVISVYLCVRGCYHWLTTRISLVTCLHLGLFNNALWTAWFRHF